MKECITHFACDCLLAKLDRLKAELDDRWAFTDLRKERDELREKLKVVHQYIKQIEAVFRKAAHVGIYLSPKTCAGYLTEIQKIQDKESE
jgi:hypothetical protein